MKKRSAVDLPFALEPLLVCAIETNVGHAAAFVCGEVENIFQNEGGNIRGAARVDVAEENARYVIQNEGGPSVFGKIAQFNVAQRDALGVPREKSGGGNIAKHRRLRII